MIVLIVQLLTVLVVCENKFNIIKDEFEVISVLNRLVEYNSVEEFMFVFVRAKLYDEVIDEIIEITKDKPKFVEVLSKYMIHNSNYSHHYKRAGRFLLRKNIIEYLPDTTEELFKMVCASHNINPLTFWYIWCRDDHFRLSTGPTSEPVYDIIVIENAVQIVSYMEIAYK